MISDENAKSIVQASMYFHELFRKTVLSSAMRPMLTRTQMDILLFLDLEEPMNMSTLSRRVGIAPEQATRAMKGLREHGLVETSRDETNRRMVIAKISEKGALLMGECKRSVNESAREVLNVLSDADLEQLVSAARTATDILRKTTLRHTVSDPDA